MKHNDIQLMRKREYCPSCHSTSFVPLYSESFSGSGIKKYIDTHYKGRASRSSLDGFNYELVQCANCNLAYQIYVPTDRLLSEIYDVWIPKSAREELRGAHNLDDYRYLSEQVQFFIQHFRLPPHSINVLDFGFGWAEWAKMAMAYGCDVAGSELSQERIEYARSIGLKVVDTQELPANQFHFINTEQVFEHIVEPRELLAHLVVSLRVGGIIKISVPNSNGSLRKLKRTRDFSSLSPNEIMPIAPLEHINSFSYRSLVALANTVGLRPLRPSLRKIYNSSSGWLNIKNAIRLVIRPLYRHVFPKSTFVYFVLAQPSASEGRAASGAPLS
jgi:SAM-dependent methyltransferase